MSSIHSTDNAEAQKDVPLLFPAKFLMIPCPSTLCSVLKAGWTGVFMLLCTTFTLAFILLPPTQVPVH